MSIWKKVGIILSGVVGVAAVGLALTLFILPDIFQKEETPFGLQTIGADVYYYDADGEPLTGFQTIDGELYYFDPVTGKALTGWYTADDGAAYFFGPDGVALTGTHTIDGEEYTFDKKGRLVAGEETGGYVWREVDGKTYCAAPDGSYVTGLEKVNGAWYYFDKDGVRQAGWHTINGERYYFDENTGRAPKGWKTLDGQTYYFAAGGYALTGSQTIGGQSYTFDSEGRLTAQTNTAAGKTPVQPLPASPPASAVTSPEPSPPTAPVVTDPGYSWKEKDGNKYYENANGEPAKGLMKIDGQLYYFDASGRIQTGWQTVSGRLYFFDAQGRAQTGWAENEGANYYLCKDGYAVTGLQSISAGRYFFDERGVRQNGLLTINGRVYCFTGENDAAITGWYPKEPPAPAPMMRSMAARTANAMAAPAADTAAPADEAYYYFGDEYFALTGVRKIGNYYFGFDEKTGQQLYGWQRLGGGLYYFNETGGSALTGVWRQHADGAVYFGSDGAALTGPQTIAGALYGFDNNGFRMNGWVKFGSDWYALLGANDSALTSQWKEKEGGWAYLDGNGAATTGVATVPARDGDGQAKALYFFDGEGASLTGWQPDANGRLYFLGEDGMALYGEQKRGDDTYYIGDGGYALTGTATIGDKFYLFNEKGVRQQDVQSYKGVTYGFLGDDGAAVKGWKTVGANTYYFGDAYAAATGIQWVVDGWYCFSAGGVRQTGWQVSAKDLYYFDEQTGKAHTGWMIDVNQKAQFYFTGEGKALANTTETIDGVAYKFDANGKLVPGGEAEGDWITRGGQTYYLYKNGEYATGVVVVDQKLFGFTAAGEKITGWHEAADGKTYYFGGEDGEAIGGWLPLDGKHYYFGANGVALTGPAEIEEQDGTWLYYLNEDGSRHEGEKELDGKIYYFDPANSGRAHTGWYPEIGADKARYYGDAGFALTGVQPIGSEEAGYTRYWFDDKGYRQTGWLRGGSIYAFLGENGAALTGPKTLDGKHYLFGGDGVAVIGLNRGDAGLSCYGKDGARQSDWVDYGAHRYWFDANGIAPSGLAEVGDDSYYFGDEGYILTDTTVNTEDGWAYELDKDGRLLKAGATEGYKWREVDGHTYYMDSRGFDYALAGLETIDGGLYYLLEEGALKGARQYGWRQVGGAWYHFGDDGRAQRGWFVDTDERAFYFDEEHKMVTGEVTIELIDYEFDAEDGHLLDGYDVPRFNEWGEDDGGVYYLDATGKRATGLVPIDGGLHYFTGQGVLQTGFITLESGRYYFSPAEKGKAATGWAQVDGVWYEFHDTTAVQQLEWRYRVDDDGNQCAHYFYEDGTVPAGFETVNGVKRYFYEDGCMALDWQTIGGHRYYFYPDTGRMATGVSLVEDAWFSFDGEGRQYVGFNTDVDGRRYYFSETGKLAGWQPIDGVWYCFDENGVQQMGWQHRDDEQSGKKFAYYYDASGNVPGEGWKAVSGVTRYFFADGRMAQGFEKIGQEFYYFYDNGTTPSGPATVDGVWYPFDAEGRFAPGWYEGGAVRYYYTETGALTGWHKLDGGKWVYFHESNARQQFGWQERTGEDGKTYKHYFYTDGSTPEKWDTEIDGVKRYFFEDGTMAAGWHTVDVGERYFYADGRMASGVALVDGGLRAFDADGGPAAGWCYDSAQNRYYFTDSSTALRGWHLTEGKWYSFDPETAVQRTGWQTRAVDGANLQYYYHANGDAATAGWTDEIDGADRYILADGQAAQGWTELAGGRRLFGERGEMYTGWTQYQSRWYHLDEATGVQQTGWQPRTLDGAEVKYYYNADGSLPGAGWQTVDGAKRYVLADGRMAAGWQTLGSYTYYFNNDGVYVTGAQTIGGTVYRFDSTGYYIKAPVINSAVNKAVNGATQSVTVSATANAALQNKTLSYSFDGGKTWQAAAGKNFAVGTALAANAIQVKDSVGNITQYGKAMQLGTAADYKSFGIDVSAWQGNIDWAKVKASGVEFAIIRGFTHNGSNYIIDPYFDYNVRQAKANGIKVGAYLYCYAYNVWGIENEVDIFYNSATVKKLMSDGITFDLPVYIDYEDPYVLNHTAGMSKADRTRIARRGLEKITERSGGKHTPGIYSYRSFLENSIDGLALQNEGYEVWIAELGASYKWPTKVPVWQYSWTGRIGGINGDVDLNYCFKDYGGSGSTGGVTPPPVTPPVAARNLTVTDQYGNKVTASAESILAQIVEAEMGGFRSTLTAAQAEEVFKAQAVAAQTWILYNNARGVSAPQVALKTPSTQVQSAVGKVVNKKMTYNGGNVCSTYFASCGSYNGVIKTNNSAYWGSSHGYLSSVSSTESQAKTVSSGSISNANLRARIIAVYGEDLTAGKDPSTWIKIEGRNAAGYVTKVSVCGRTPSVDYFYQTFMRGATTSGSKINSPAFNFSYSNGQWNYSYTGAGHGIGMSQWGAYEMAKAGSGYEAILKHYYQGVAVSNVQ